MGDILQIDVRALGASGTVVVAFRGELDISVAGAARSALRAASAGRPRMLAIDLTGLSFMDCAGAMAVKDGHLQAVASGVSVVVRDGRGGAHRIITLLGLDEVLDLVEDLPALAG